jgi:hypothetical protein
MYRTKILGALLMLLVQFAFGIDKPDLIADYSSALNQISRLKVFVEGRGIDYNYIRRNINFVDFVNDPKASDVHIIISQKSNGGGGRNYFLNFYSKNISQIGDITLNCVSGPSDTNDMIRECLSRALKLGLMPYVNETANSDLIDIMYTKPDNENVVNNEIEDFWRLWVFRIDAHGGFNLEESIRKYNYSFNVRADKVTEKIKIRASYYMRDRFEQIDTDGGLLMSENNHKNSNLSSVYSLSERWSTGLFLSYFQSTYWNTNSSYDVKPAIEYNFFPWDEADQRIFTISYFAGLEVKDYYETTIFGKNSEDLWAQNLRVKFEMVQPWGQIGSRLEGATYFHDITKNRLSFSSDVSFRITKGLSLNFGFKAENVHNQLYLPAGGVSLEDILLGNQKLPSTFELSGGMGVRIQFGSLYNNVVNNRL